MLRERPIDAIQQKEHPMEDSGKVIITDEAHYAKMQERIKKRYQRGADQVYISWDLDGVRHFQWGTLDEMINVDVTTATRLRRSNVLGGCSYTNVNQFTDENGYILQTRSGKNKGVHRHVMEQKLGRDLLPGENVHHINGVRDDNRPENLELWVSSQPAGQRPEDLVAWAHEILDKYEPV